MARSLGLTAYRALTRRGNVPSDPPATPRPDGELVWLHAGEVSNLVAVQNLAARLVASRPGLSILITVPDDHAISATPPHLDKNILQMTVPGEHPANVNAFLDHWAPNAGIWVWGGLRPNLILAASERACPLVLIDADGSGFDKRHSRWLPDVTRQILSTFDCIFARSDIGKKQFEQMGISPDQLEQTSPLLAGGQVLPCIDSDLSDLAGTLGGRPTWFAAQVLAQEIPIVLSAHQMASRMSHRLLLLLQPANAAEVDSAVDLATERGLNVVRWAEGQFPDETTQVMLSDTQEDQGLFFRVAPVSFLGSTLFPGSISCDPMNVAALGSAVLYGPKVREYMHSYSRLAAAGAARIVNDADALGTAVTNLIAPDHAAAMAHAGWDVISRGAELADKVVDLIQDILDLEMARP
ncbi:MAG: glycosyltransferase N-terminal domain-containing protein [Sulfitobacter sp.]